MCLKYQRNHLYSNQLSCRYSHVITLMSLWASAWAWESPTVSTDNGRANLIFCPHKNHKKNHNSHTHTPAEIKVHDIYNTALYWGTVEWQITHWPSDHLSTWAIMKGKVFFLLRGLGGERVMRPCYTGVVPSQAPVHCEQILKKSRGAQECYVYAKSQ